LTEEIFEILPADSVGKLSKEFRNVIFPPHRGLATYIGNINLATTGTSTTTHAPPHSARGSAVIGTIARASTRSTVGRAGIRLAIEAWFGLAILIQED
jgi:hypothetical protein